MSENKSTSRVERRQAKKNKPNKKGFFRRLVRLLIIIIVVATIGVGGLFTYYIATAPPLDPAKLSDPFSTEIYDMKGNHVGELGDVKRTKVEYDDLPQVLIDAIIATEDVRFFTHPGIDLFRIGGAIKANITRGFGAEGASTITQQVAENSFLESDKKIKLKVQEQWIALKLERKYSKEEILEMYLNKIFYGSNSYGVVKAAENYFGKEDLNDLTLVEAAILAGLPQRPTAYNPYENPELTKGRVDTVLKLMVRHDKITQAEADEARQVDIESLLVGKSSGELKYEGFIQQIDQEVKEKLNDADIFTDGLKVYTTLDTDVQEYVEFLLTDSDENPIPYTDKEMKAGLVVLDTQSGAIRAVGGSRNSENRLGTNYALTPQQPGSTFKPLLSFGPAIEYNNVSTYHQINDDGEYYPEGSDSPIRNWNRSYQGWMSARYALTHSLNVPTVKLLDEVGYDQAQTFAEGLGIEFPRNAIDPRDAIGGTDTNISPLALAGAYRAFGNEGIYNDPYAVTKVEFPDGKVVEFKPEPEAAMADSTAYMVTDMLKSVMTEGTGTGANIPGLPVAGKTGTTNLQNKAGSPDAWFSGYTTNFTIAIWVGGYTDEENRRTVMPSNATQIPRILFKNLMTEISKDIETPDFVQPDSVVELGIARGSNPPAISRDGNAIYELFVRGHEPTSTSRPVEEESDQFSPVTGLSANYNEATNDIDISWNYDSTESVSFQVNYSINGGEMSSLTTTTSESASISDVEAGGEYSIEVIVTGDGSSNSDSSTTSITVPGSNEDNEAEDFTPVSGLNASYLADSNTISVSWGYDGIPTAFEVNVNGEIQNVKTNGVDIKSAVPGQSYSIKVTPISNGSVNPELTQETSVTIPEKEDEPEINSGNNTENNNSSSNNKNVNENKNNKNDQNINNVEENNNSSVNE